MEYDLIKRFHDNSHFCDMKVKELIAENYFIDDLNRKVKIGFNHNNCIKCILVNRKLGKQECLLRPIDKLQYTQIM